MDAPPSSTGNTAPGLTTASILFFLWAILTFVVRVWVKAKKSDSWGTDDTAISVAAAATLANVVATSFAIHRGYGNPWSVLSKSDIVPIRQALFAAQILYVVSVGCTRISTSFFTTRFLTRGQQNVRLAHSFTATCAVWSVASIFVVAIRPSIAEPWDTLDGTAIMFHRWLAIEIAGFIIDVSTLALCVYFIWDLQMPIKKRLAISAIFAIRLAVAPVIALRLYFLAPTTSNNPNPDLPALTAAVFTSAVMNFTLILASVTCLKPFLRPFDGGFLITSMHSHVPAFGAAPITKGSAYYELSATQRSALTTQQEKMMRSGDRKHRSVTVSARGVDEDYDGGFVQVQAKPPLALRRDRVEQRATVGHDSVRPSMERDGEQMLISKTQAWTVSFEQ